MNLIHRKEVVRGSILEVGLCKAEYQNNFFWRRKNMLRNRMMVILGLLVTASMILSACGGATTPTTAPETQAPQVQPTEAPTQAPTEAPTATAVPVTRKGPWVDEIDFSEQS